MPETSVIFYQESPTKVPVLDWLEELKKRNRQGYSRCQAVIKLLQKDGYELKRPHEDYLRDDIRELRAHHETVRYRILYFFDCTQQNRAVLAHAFIKKGAEVPPIEIKRAKERKERYYENPQIHTYSISI